ncbi:hypothetical protein BDV19DRAFT_24940 [Aspergillus venezuelensis]
MSTQFSTPLTPRGPRNNRRNQKKTTTSSAHNASTLSTPPSSPPGAASPREAPTDSSGTITLSKKKGNRSAKKPRDVNRTSPTTSKPGHRHTSSHPNNINTPHLKDTHYAGPTFHASPAPSALPIPSFFSKSFPESDLAPTLEHDSDSFEADADIEITPSKPKSRPCAPQEERESTPLDFLFKAAVDARRSQPQQSPEPSPRAGSPQTDSKAFLHRRSNNDNARMFPFEMEAPDQYSQIGPSFAPSYKDRMNALRSASSPSPGLQDLDEEERKAKTAALKTLLLNPRPQRPSSISQSSHDQMNQKQDRPVLSPMVPPHFATPMRTTSGPPTMHSHGDHSGKHSSPLGFAPRRESHHMQFNSPQHHHAHDHILGNGILASTPGNAPPTPRHAYDSPSRGYSPSKFPGHQQSPVYYPQLHSMSPVSQNLPPVDTKKMEDDLRRILKLDVNSSIASSGIQSSLA